MLRGVVAGLLLLGSSALVSADTPAEAARALVARYHLDPTVIDRARDLLEAAVARDRQVDTITMLAYVHFLWGDVRATTEDEKLAAYERGREFGKRAVELAPRSHDAHLWYAINTGRWGQTKGILRSLFLLPTVREHLDIALELNPRSPRAHTLAGNVYFEVPGLFGGDRTKAEEHLRKALEINPRYTVARVDLARVLIAAGRRPEARRELERVLNESAPAALADWTVKDVPRARHLLDSIRETK